MALRGVVLGAIALVLVSGCEPAGEPSPTSGETEFAALFETIAGYSLAEVEQNGLSPGTIELLGIAAERGYVTRGDVEEAVNLTFACFDELGIQWERNSGTDLLGLPDLGFTYRAPVGVDPFSTEWLPSADQCESANSGIIGALYDNQPQTTPERQAWFAQNGQTETVACLVERGIEVDGDHDLEWFIETSKEYLDETGDSTCLEIIFG